MELRQLRYFVAVAETKSFSQAARRLNISQPPLGRQITQLEEELDVKLLVRSARPLRLTPAGEIMLEHANEILGKVREMVTDVRAANMRERARLVIGFTDSSLYGAFPEVMRRIKALNDLLDVELVQLEVSEQIQSLRDNRIDLGFNLTPIDAQDLDALVLRRERLVIAVPLNHKWALERSPLSLVNLASETLITFPGSPHPNFGDQVIEILKRHDLTAAKVQIVQGLHSALGLVAAQLGIAIVPAAAQEARTRDVRYLAIQEQDATCPIIMLRRAGDQSVLILVVLRIIAQLNRERGFTLPKEFAA